MTSGSTRRTLRRALTAAAIALCVLRGPWPDGHAAAAKDRAAGTTDAARQDRSRGEIRLGMSADFTASARALGIELYRGAMAYLLPVNATGGVNGRSVVIKAYDDRYAPELAILNTLKLMNQDDVFALFGYVGTPTMNRALPLLRMHRDKGFLLLFPFTGAATNRIPPYDQFSFNLRASYDQETTGLVDHFVGVERPRIAVFYQADAYGRAGWAGVRRALAKHGLEIAGEATYRHGSPFDQSYDGQVAIMQRLRPDAVICVGTYPATAGFVRDMRDRGVDSLIATISFVGSEEMLALLSAATKTSKRDYTSRLVSSQVVPSYHDDSIPVAREYRKAMDRYRDAIMPAASLLYPDGKVTGREYAPLSYSFTSLEGYLDAKLFVEILRRMGPAPSRARLPQIVMGMGEFDLGMDDHPVLRRYPWPPAGLRSRLLHRGPRRTLRAAPRPRVEDVGEPMRIARFYQKTLFGMFALMGLVVASTSILYVHTVDRELTEDFLKSSRAIARTLASSNIDLIVDGNYSALQSIIDQFVDVAGISYVFVVDAQGIIVAHTFVPGVPGEIVADYRDGRDVYDRGLAGRGRFSEVTAGILGGAAGRVHVGADKGYVALQVQTAIGKQVYLLTIIFVVSVLVSYGLMYQISRPLDHLGRYAWHAFSEEDRGDPPHPSHVKNLLERTDEVGELGRLIHLAADRRQ